jgi:hypothetical protein
MSYIVILFLLASGFSVPNADAYAEKMSEYYGYPVRYEVRDIGEWMAATLSSDGRCTTRVFLDDQFLARDDDLWKGVLAHEWAHTLQGSKCGLTRNQANEDEADRVALDALWQMNEISAYFRYSIFLQERWNWTPEMVYGR